MINKEKIQSIVGVFETGSATPKYQKLVVMADGRQRSRQITYGKHQTTEQGNLVELIKDYCADDKSQYKNALQPYLTLIGRSPLADDKTFKEILIEAGMKDDAMKRAQDNFFDKFYWASAEKFFTDSKFTYNLSMLVIYDSHIHSGCVPPFLRRLFAEKIPSNGGDEKEWIKFYVEVRQNWFINNKNKLLQKCTYRTQCFKNQISSVNWDLANTVNANGILIK